MLLGLLLRYYFVRPLDFNFRYVLHAHSHTMLLGWLFSGLLLLIYQQVYTQIPKLHFRLFIALQICVVGMLCTFPFQGYGLYSIIFSTLHIIISYVLLWKLWKACQNHGLSGKLVRAGIVFHFLSTLGPYALGPIIAMGLRGSALYDQAIYFYLHFQYNGSFFFFLLALILPLGQKAFSRKHFGLAFWLMLFGVVFTWAHSLDFSYQGWWINALGLSGSMMQIVAGLMLFKRFRFKEVGLAGTSILVALALKFIFQLIVSYPAFGEFVAQNRFLIIAWLHFIFLGIYTPFIWWRLAGNISGFRPLFALYWFFFLLTELALIMPFLNISRGFQQWPQLTFSFYVGLAIIWLALAVRWWRFKPALR